MLPLLRSMSTKNKLNFVDLYVNEIDMETWREKTVSELKRLGISKSELARRLGIDRAVPTRWFKPGAGISAKNFQKITDIISEASGNPQLGEELFELYAREVYKFHTQTECRIGENLFTLVDKIGPIASGGSGLIPHEIYEGKNDQYAFRSDWLRKKVRSIKYLGIIEIKGDSMHPLVSDGDFCLYDSSKTDPKKGRLMVVILDKYVLVKRVTRVEDGHILSSENSKQYPDQLIPLDQTYFKIIGTVFWRCGDVT